jgi:hypothetical protein
MSPRETTNGGPPAGPAIVEKITTATKQHDHRKSTALAEVLIGFVTILLGGPGAAQDRAMLRDCPLNCGAVHVFYVRTGMWRGGQPLVRAPRCAPHRRMRLEVVDVLPAAVPVAGTRRRWTA